MSIICVELCGSSKVARWDSNFRCLPNRDDAHTYGWAQKCLMLFLPEGYPESVPTDYMAYQVWDSLQALCSYVRGILTSEAILAGVTNSTSKATTGLSVVFQFFLRDFSGMLGGVLFATYQGSGLDSHAKQWRLFADCFNNVGMALELASPLYPPAFLLLACCGSIARAITGVAGGATRAALTQHFSHGHNNAADISAKEGSQETATTLIGMVLGMLITHLCSGSRLAVWIVFICLTYLHIFANIRAMRSLQVQTVNMPRLQILLAPFVAEEGKSQQRAHTPAQVAACEPLLVPPLRTFLLRIRGAAEPQIVLGAPMHDLVASPGFSLASLLKDGAQSKYVVQQTKGKILVALRSDASSADIFKSAVHAHVLAAFLARRTQQGAATTHREKIPAWLKSEAWMEKHGDHFQQELQRSGWSLTTAALGVQQWRAEWGEALHLHTS